MRRFLVIFFLGAGLLCAAEEITDFHSRIEMQKSGDLLVTETITVQAEGDEIKRGIYRDFPTLYRGRFGLKARVPFEVLETTRNGEPESSRTEPRDNGVRIYLGRKDVLLDAGQSTYVIRYRTGRQLGFFPDHDELYWNVTGHGWVFPIARASAEVVLPPGATLASAEAYTGPQGAKGQDYTVVKKNTGAFFATTLPLPAKSGLTIVVTWPKGFVDAPPPRGIIEQLARDNVGIVLGLAGLLAALAYFSVTWAIVGRDPQRGVIIPRYEAPGGLSPAAVRYVRGLGKFDDTSLAASVLHLAVVGAIKIKGGDKNDYIIEKRPDRPDLPPEARTLFQELLGSRQELRFDNANHTVFQKAKAALLKAVSKQCDAVFFVRNRPVWVIGLLLTLVPLGVSLFDASQPAMAGFLLLWLSIWSLGVVALSSAAISAWKQKGWKRLGAVPLTIFALPFLGGWFFGMGLLIWSTSVWVCAIYLAGIAMVVGFHHLFKRPTAPGRAALDEIEGFRRYLSVAEEDRLNLENPPERTPELFEKFLPYALALGVQQLWAEQFSGVLGAAQYQPEWYSGNQSRNFQAAAFGAGLASALVRSVSSSSSAPGSSSGRGGGGSSGGGGGGGGGGGW